MIKSFEILSVFPEFFEPFLKTVIMQRAKGKVSIRIRNIRDYADDKRRTVDDTPYGGGCGMVLKPEPLALALDEIKERQVQSRKIIFLSPQGKVFNHSKARDLLQFEEVVLISGRYEGVDQRIIDLYVDEEISIGDFVLSGGELPAMAVMESVLRLVPGVLGNEESFETDTFSCGLFKYPQYTRPQNFRGLEVPGVLLSGDHERIKRWRDEQAREKTRKIRPDLFMNGETA